MSVYNITAEAYSKRGRLISKVGAKATLETESDQRATLVKELFTCNAAAFKVVTCRGAGFDIRAHYRQNMSGI